MVQGKSLGCTGSLHHKLEYRLIYSNKTAEHANLNSHCIQHCIQLQPGYHSHCIEVQKANGQIEDNSYNVLYSDKLYTVKKLRQVSLNCCAKIKILVTTVIEQSQF